MALSAALLLSASLPAPLLERAGSIWRVALAFVLVCGAQAMGLLPLAATGALSAEPESTAGALAGSCLWLGASMVAVVLGANGRRANQLWLVWVVGGVILAFFALAHVVTGASTVLGIVAPRVAPVRFWAPFVNPNHFCALLLLVFPVALGSAVGRGTDVRRGISGLAAIVIGGTVLATGAGAPVLVLGLQAVVIGATLWRPLGCVAPLSLPVLVPVAMRWATSHGGDSTGGLVLRGEIWRTGLRALWDHPITGVGAGAFDRAVQPYRADVAYVSWAHAHNDWLEWVVETGAVGSVAGAVAGVALLVVPRADSQFLWRLRLGLAGLGVYALYDFPLQIAAVPMVAGIAVGWVIGSASNQGRSVFARALLAAAAGTCLVASAWEMRTAAVEQALPALRSDPTDMAASGWVRWLAPWRPEPRIAELRSALAAERPSARDLALALSRDYPRNADVQRISADALRRLGAFDSALVSAERAVELAPWDPRVWRTRALCVTAIDPSAASEAWGDAIAARVPGAQEAGWSLVPVGLYWVQELADAPPRVQADLGDFLREKGAVSEAMLAYEGALLVRSDLYMRGYLELLLAQGEHDAAEAYARGLLVHHPEDLWLREKLAVALERGHQWKEARDLWIGLWEERHAGLGRAARCEGMFAGETAGRNLWRRHELLGHALTSRDRLDYASWLLELGDLAGCAALVEERDVVVGAPMAGRARALRRSCEGGQ